MQQSYFHEYIENKNIDDLIKSVNTKFLKMNNDLKLLHEFVIELVVQSNSLIEKYDIKLKQLLHTKKAYDIIHSNKNLKSFQSLQNKSST